MEYKSSGEFIPKLYTDNFMIGSFDVYLDKSKELIEKNKFSDKYSKNSNDSVVLNNIL